MRRPEHLPDFGSPPLDELVIGVQFSPSPNYSSVLSGDIWRLYKDEFPIVQEMPSLEPSFETFGGSNLQSGMHFKFGSAPLRSRLWFVSKDQDHLIQFQDDRFLLNWRKRSSGCEYPRFEKVAEDFRDNLEKLKIFYDEELSSPLEANQCELSYINIIPVDEFSDASEWLSFWGLKGLNVENMNLAFNDVVYNQGGKPFARMIYELQTAISKDGKQKALRLSLSFRGKPDGGDVAKVMDFIELGREKIVTRFSDLTSEKAHKTWERKI